LLLIAVTVWTVWANTALECNLYTISSPSLPQAFDGFRIVQVSDLHNDVFGKDNGDLLEMIRDAEPNMIAITGDMIDSYDTDPDFALAFAAEAVKIAPCYYVTGNHEPRHEDWRQFLLDLKQAGVHVLYDARAEIEINGEKIAVLGINDPVFETYEDMNIAVSSLMGDEAFSVLLSHRPELMADYAAAGVDLVLSGHAHGGQFRLPFVGGLFAPDQGIFPVYDAGEYHQDGTTMIVSRGIGNSAFPFRINNRPEIVVVELKGE